MVVNDYARDDGSENESEEESGESSGDEGYDYGFAGDNDDEEEEEGGDYEVDFTNMNVSPEILRMLGASEEVIAAKEAEVAGVTSTWVPPTETGLEHSAAIADSAAVAIGGGKASGGGGVQRVFKSVGAFDGDKNNVATPAEGTSTLKVNVVHCPEAVPKNLESKLPPRSDGGGSVGHGSDSDSSWDEASAIDGHAWWESGSEDEEHEMVAMSPNLMVALGLAKPSQEPAATKEGGEGGGMGDWRPPMFSGLTNSKPLTTLMPVVVGHNKKALEVQYKNKGGEDGQDGDIGDGEWSEEEGWDYEDIPDDAYILDWSTNISPNLAKAIGNCGSNQPKTDAITAQLSWKPPTTFGLKNSAPIVNFLK
ncbi:unnamed protein product [Pylaiella littoralis]